MTETNLSVPASETAITKRWLSRALAHSFPDATFAALEQTRIGENYGFASRLFRFRWQDDETRKSVVVKLWDADSKAGTGEVHFYQTFKEVGTRVPKCYYSAADMETSKAVLVLEDLKNVVQGDVLELVNLERAKGIARSLARLHATWLDHPKLTEHSWLPDESTWTPKRDWINSRRALFLERFPNHLSGLARLLFDKLELAPKISNARLSDSPITLLHGDFHLDNLVFEKETEPIVLDWSRPVKGPPVLNLAVLLFTMTPLKNFDEVFDCYLTDFTKLSKYQLHRTNLERQVGAALLRLFAISTCGVARWQPSLPRAKEMIENGIDEVNRSVEFWQERDPMLFSFLH